jgi:hypothetical protein
MGFCPFSKTHGFGTASVTSVWYQVVEAVSS